MKQDLANRHKESHDHRDDTGKYRPIFKDKDKLKLWKASDEDHVIDIIPYLCGKFDPTEREGKVSYVLDVWVHRKVGPNEDTVICPAITYKRSPIPERQNWKCPICERRAALKEKNQTGSKEYKDTAPTRRVIYNMVCLDTEKEIAKGVQIWDVSHYLFEKKIAELALLPKGGGFVLFSDADEGKSISFVKKATSYKDEKTNEVKQSTEYSAFRFLDRAPLDDKYLEQGKCLDELVTIYSYDELYQMIYREPPASEKEEAAQEREAEATGRAPEHEDDVPADKGIPPAEADESCPMGGTKGKDFGAWDECKSDCHMTKECEAAMPKKDPPKAPPAGTARTGLRSRLGGK